MRRRAERVEETRRRITEAAVELHGTVGPARTTISAIAELAGVERLTVYRHFPDEAALFQACSSHWLALNPLPDPGGWGETDDVLERLERALTELYAWYRRTEQMMSRIVRDGPLVPALAGPLADWRAYEQAVVDVLATGWGVRGRRRRLVLAALGHATAFTTWASLAERGLAEGEAVEVMRGLVASAAGYS